MIEPYAGETVDERFVLLELIGRGGMGSVFKAMDLATGLPVALKFPFFELESDPAFYSRFQREIEIGNRLNHPGVLKILAVDRPSRPYLAMEYLYGETLWDLLQRSAPLPTRDALCIATLVCDALEYLHSHDVVHRDLKPTNIMLCRDGSLRIMDFGIAMGGPSRRLTFAGFSGRLGTPAYMAPEQVKGRRGDPQTDIYGLGAVLYEMITARTPYDEQADLYAVMTARLVGDPTAPRVHNTSISPEVEEIILHALARDPRDRYPTAAAMRAELVAPERVRVTGRASRLQAPSLKARHWRILRFTLFVLTIPVLLFFMFLLIFRR